MGRRALAGVQGRPEGATRNTGMNKSLHRSGLAAAAVLCLVAGASGRAAAPAADTVIARVGGDTIRRDALMGYLNRFYGTVSLRELELRSALRQEAARYGVTVTDADLDARAAELRKATGNHHQDLLNEEGISDAAWRDRIRYTLLAEKISDRKWPITDNDLQRYSVRYARTITQAQARDIITEAKNGVDFRLLAVQRGLDRENDAYVAPNPFFRVDAPQFFKMTQEANLRPGQVTNRPIQSGKYWLVLKLEKSLPPSTLSARERELAVKRVRAIRVAGLADLLKRRYRSTESFTPDAPDGRPEDVAATTGTDKIARRDVELYELQYFGRQAIERLAERAVVTQMADKANVHISDAEVNDRVAALRKASGPTAFQQALDLEGISQAAWAERVRYSLLAEKVLAARNPVQPDALTRLTVRYIHVANRRNADAVIQALQGGARFDTVMQQASVESNSDGYIKPRPFTQAENPAIYKLVTDAKVSPRHVLPNPVPVGDSWVVLWLEARQTAADMKPEERDAAIQRINALRLGQQLDAWKKETKVETVVPIERLIDQARGS